MKNGQIEIRKRKRKSFQVEWFMNQMIGWKYFAFLVKTELVEIEIWIDEHYEQIWRSPIFS